MNVWRRVAMVLVLAALVGGCTIEQDLTPRIDSAGTQTTGRGTTGGGTTGGGDDDPSSDGDDEPTEAPSEAPSEEPSDEPSDEPSEISSPVAGNTPPTSQDDRASTSEDTPVTIAVLDNDSDADGDTLVPSVRTAPARGRASVAGSSIRYVPDANANGTDTFTYAVDDGRGGVGTASVTVVVAPVNDAPKAVDDQLTTPEDTTVTIDALANDVDVDGDSLTITAVGKPTKGAARTSGGKVVYDPAANVTGKDTFTYTVSDPSGATDTASITIDIGGRNDPPIARSDSARTPEDKAVVIDVLANDSDPDGDGLALASAGAAGKGKATVTAGKVTYTPNADVTGSDSFSYTVSDPSGATATGTVTVTIDPVNDPPSARDDTMTVDEDSGATAKNVVANDVDVDGDGLSVTAVTQPSLGKVTFSGANVTFTPNSNANGATSFTYTVSDGSLTDTATVNVTIRPVNDPPVAAGNGPYLVQLGQSVTITDLLANDSDPDGDSLSIELVGSPKAGSVSAIDDTTVQYSNKSWVSGESFTYRVSDGSATSNTVTVTLTINRPPVARNDSFSLITGFGERLVDFNVITGTVNSGCCSAYESFSGGKDDDPDGDAVTFVSPTALRYRPTWLTGFQCNSSGRCQLKFAECQNRVYSFTYTIQDATGATAQATVTFNLNEQCIY